MRALFLTALLATAASAQDAPLTAPLSGADRCDAPAAMPAPFENAPGAEIPESDLDGPAPVAMPNLCGEVALGPPPADDGVPAVYRGLYPPPAGAAAEALRRYRHLLGRPAPGAAPVAPPPEHE